MPKFPKILRPPKGGAGIDEIIAQVEKALGSYSKRPIKAVRDLLIKQAQENPAPLELEPGTQSVFLGLLQSAMESLRKSIPYSASESPEHTPAPLHQMNRLDNALFRAQRRSALKGRTGLPAGAAYQESQPRLFEGDPREDLQHRLSQIDPPPIPLPIRARRPGVEISRPFPAEGPAELYVGDQPAPPNVSMQEAMRASDEMRAQKQRTKVGSRVVRRTLGRSRNQWPGEPPRGPQWP